jgi:poly(A) polymerase
MIYDLVCLSLDKNLIDRADEFQEVTEKKLVNSEEIIKITSLSGRNIQKAIYLLDRERFYGRIGTREEAILFLKKLSEFGLRDNII